MARTDTTRRRRRYTATPEQRAAAQERDRNLRSQAAADMADPEVIARRIRQVLADGMPARLRTYSLRNVLLILRQAEERGITLTDIDTKKGWRRRGRLIAAGQAGLRIVRPIGADDDKPTAADEADTNADDSDDGEHNARPRFRMSPRWDISQTVPIDDAAEASGDDADCAGCHAGPGEACHPGCTCTGCTGQTAAPESAPAEVVWNSLQDQITKAGYRFDWPADAAAVAGAQVRTDHDTKTVHVDMFADAGDPGVIAALAVVLGEIITHADRDRAERTQPRRAIEAAPVG